MSRLHAPLSAVHRPRLAAFALAAMLPALPLTAQWVEAFPGNLNTPLVSPAMVGGPAGDVFLFGGNTEAGANPLSSTTRVWNGGDWYVVNVAGGVSPSPRQDAAFVYDSGRGRYVLYGGNTSTVASTAASDETWEFTGTAWSLVNTPTNPGGLCKHGACYDSLRQRTVVFGGAQSGTAAANGTTWEYDGATWVQVASIGSPGAREDHGMCFHAGLGRTVLFGGLAAGTVSSQTWLYDGLHWTLAATATNPPPRRGAGLVYDGARGVVILCGGVDGSGSALADTWEFDGTAWTQQPTTTAAGRDFGFALDMARRRVLRYGGDGNPGETWLYGAAVDGISTGCVGSAGVVTLGGSPARIGEPFVAVLNHLPLSFGVVILSFTSVPPVPLDVFGMTGCMAYVTPDVLFTVAGSGGTATFQGVLPPNLSLLGVAMYGQGLSFDPGWNPASLVSSSAFFWLVGH